MVNMKHPLAPTNHISNQYMVPHTMMPFITCYHPISQLFHVWKHRQMSRIPMEAQKYVSLLEIHPELVNRDIHNRLSIQRQMLIFHHHLIPNSDEQSLKWMMKMQLFCKAYYMSLTTELTCNTSNQIQKSVFDATKQKQYCCVFLHPNRIFVLQFQTINNPNPLTFCLVHQFHDQAIHHISM